MRNEFKELAISTARKAGALLKEGLSLEKKIGYKGVVNLVTETDIKSQELIVSEITKNLPDHGIISEENLEERTKARYLWIIDPLDGTTNYAHRYPIFSISMALAEEGEIILGVVHDPNFDELFFAEKGCGAFLNDKPIRVSKTALLNSSLLATGFPYYIRERPGKVFRYFQEFSLRSQG
ncbi:MAG: inositol monophosphatase family protein, partial [Actinomycetota bacterium]